MLLDIFDEKLHPLTVRYHFSSFHKLVQCATVCPVRTWLFMLNQSFRFFGFKLYFPVFLPSSSHHFFLSPSSASNFSHLLYVLLQSCPLAPPSSILTLPLSSRKLKSHWTMTNTIQSKNRSTGLSGRCSALLSSLPSVRLSHWWDLENPSYWLLCRHIPNCRTYVLGGLVLWKVTNKGKDNFVHKALQWRSDALNCVLTHRRTQLVLRPQGVGTCGTQRPLMNVGYYTRTTE